jgi:hypothetical protein
MALTVGKGRVESYKNLYFSLTKALVKGRIKRSKGMIVKPIAFMTNDTLGRQFTEQVVKHGYQPEVVECLSYQDPPPGHVTVRSPFCGEWGSGAEDQIFIKYDANEARCTARHCNTYYPYRVVKTAVEKYVRVYVHKRLTKAERKAQGLTSPKNETLVCLSGNAPSE